MEQTFDLLILGGGPGGYVAAIRAAQLGLKAAIVEKEAIGGTCLHHGCIPSKALIRNAQVLELFQHAETFGIKAEKIQPDFGAAVERSQQVARKLHRGVMHLMKKHRVAVFEGFGKLISSREIEVAGPDCAKIVRGDHIIIATGSCVRSLPNLPIDGVRIITSDDALRRKTLPKSVLIVGGGAIGVEFAYIYAVYGVQVTIVEMAPSLLPAEDHEVSATLERSFKKRKISVQRGKQVKAIQEENGIISVQLQDSAGEIETLSVDMILVAVGRAPNVEGIGLDTVGIAEEPV
ncbi:MAG: FAD-dependent oxidoreductase, partial [Nitrospiria bacterium]